MANLYVRRLVKSWLTAGAVPFFDTVSREQNPNDDIWCTVDWGAPYRTKESYCDKFTEDGTISIVFFGLSGIGDDALLTAAEAAMVALMLKFDITGALVLLDHGVGIDFRQSDHYCVEYQVPYEYRD
jgi:hypothetical protein